MNSVEFKKYGHMMIDWIADFMDNIEKYKVSPQIKPRDVIKQIKEKKFLKVL